MSPSHALWRLETGRRMDWLWARTKNGGCEYLGQLGEYQLLVGDFPEAVQTGHRLVAMHSPSEVARGHYLQAMAYLRLSNWPAADAAVRSLERMAEDHDAPDIRAFSRLATGAIRVRNVDGTTHWDHVADSIALHDAAAEGFDAAGEVSLATLARAEAVELHIARSRYLPAIERGVEALEIALSHGDWTYVGHLLMLIAKAAGDQGYRNGVEATLRLARDYAAHVGDVWTVSECDTCLGRLLGYQMVPGDRAAAAVADEYFVRAEALCERYGMVWNLAGLANARSGLYRKAGDHDKSLEVLLRHGPKDRITELTLASNSMTDAIERNLDHYLMSRLADGVRNSREAFLVVDALRDAQGVCRDSMVRFGNASAAGLLGKPTLECAIFSEISGHPVLLDLDGAMDAALQDEREYEDSIVVPGDAATGAEEAWFERRIVSSGDGVVLTLRDVTAERRMEMALRQAAESAARSEAAKTSFLANMSHEIRTPLNGVLGLARMLAETELDPVQRGYVDDVIASGNSLLGIIGDVLDLSKIEAQDMRLEPKTTALGEVVGAVTRLFRGQAEEKGITLVHRLHPDLPTHVLVDPIRLHQILANLVGNAVKFTRRGGVDLEVFPAEGGIQFAVRDTGSGIPADRLDLIFERFHQAGPVSMGGTGLGLPIAKALTELMAGTVTVTSRVGEGTQFRVTLPLKAVSTRTLTERTRPLGNFGGRRVLLVDDSRVNQIVSRHALQKHGCEVVTAADGQEALDQLDACRYDLVLMDVRMPVLDGLEATRRLRRREVGDRRTPVVALTAGALLEERDECFAAGMDDFATKPFTAESIEALLAKWLPQAVAA
ncbi:MAG: ATP-binding protein [Fimbriimonas sp.]